MYADTLVNEIAAKFSALGADKETTLRLLREDTRFRLIQILDKYSRYLPFDQETRGFCSPQVLKEGNVFVARVMLDDDERELPAAIIRYDPHAEAAHVFA